VHVLQLLLHVGLLDLAVDQSASIAIGRQLIPIDLVVDIHHIVVFEILIIEAEILSHPHLPRLVAVEEDIGSSLPFLIADGMLAFSEQRFSDIFRWIVGLIVYSRRVFIFIFFRFCSFRKVALEPREIPSVEAPAFDFEFLGCHVLLIRAWLIVEDIKQSV